jgi:hypothetical protein
MAQIFTRRIEVDVEEEGQDLRVSGRLRDTRLDEDLHGIDVEMLVSVRDGEIKEISGDMPQWPMEECRQGIQALQDIAGEKIKPGFTETVRQTVGSRRGCTHLAALVMNMANTTVQGIGAYLRKHFEQDGHDRMVVDMATELGLIDSCVSWGEDGPIIRRWRELNEEENTPSPRRSHPGGEGEQIIRR